MKTQFAVLAALSLGAFAQPAAAQSVSTSTYKKVLEFAGCVVDANGDGARAVLATVPGSFEAATAISRLVAGSTCGDRKDKPEVMRGAIAERIYLIVYPDKPAEVTGTPAPFVGSGDPKLGNYDVTRCAAQRDPVGADMLVRSELRSDAEKAAVKRIIPVIGACTPAGAQIGFDREKMRGLIAEGLIAVRGTQPAPVGQ
ncbi:MAG: hypothetical protein V4574_12680 [Pseudomonadota bacterium]